MNIYEYQKPVGKIDDIPELRSEFITIYDTKSHKEMVRFCLALGQHILDMTGFKPCNEIIASFDAMQKWIDGEVNYHEARNFKNKYDRDFIVSPATESRETLDYVNKILENERALKISSKPLEVSEFIVENIKFAYVIYESGLVINVMYTMDNPQKRAVGFKLSDGMEVPKELESKFKFARQKSKLAGTIRGSFFVVKGEY